MNLESSFIQLQLCSGHQQWCGNIESKRFQNRTYAVANRVFREEVIEKATGALEMQEGYCSQTTHAPSPLGLQLDKKILFPFLFLLGKGRVRGWLWKPFMFQSRWFPTFFCVFVWVMQNLFLALQFNNPICDFGEAWFWHWLELLGRALPLLGHFSACAGLWVQLTQLLLSSPDVRIPSLMWLLLEGYFFFCSFLKSVTHFMSNSEWFMGLLQPWWEVFS